MVQDCRIRGQPFPTSGVTMKLANLNGRAALITAGGGVDVATASDGRFGPDLGGLRRLGRVHRVGRRRRSQPHGAATSRPTSVRPVPAPRQVFAIGLNYRTHAEESGMAVPDVPATFTKFPASPHRPVRRRRARRRDGRLGGRARRGDRHAGRPRRRGRRLGARRRAHRRPGHLASATLQFAAGASSRSASRTAASARWGRGWSRPTRSPTPTTSRLGCSIDGETVQDARTSDLIFTVPRLVAELSAVLPLLPGDVIFTGTPGRRRRHPPSRPGSCSRARCSRPGSRASARSATPSSAREPSSGERTIHAAHARARRPSGRGPEAHRRSVGGASSCTAWPLPPSPQAGVRSALALTGGSSRPWIPAARRLRPDRDRRTGGRARGAADPSTGRARPPTGSGVAGRRD